MQTKRLVPCTVQCSGECGLPIGRFGLVRNSLTVTMTATVTLLNTVHYRSCVSVCSCAASQDPVVDADALSLLHANTSQNDEHGGNEATGL
jgi:hypothetical protein